MAFRTLGINYHHCVKYACENDQIHFLFLTFHTKHNIPAPVNKMRMFSSSEASFLTEQTIHKQDLAIHFRQL
jgi:hypothetical protein